MSLEQLFNLCFDGSSWQAWVVIMKVLAGAPLDQTESKLFTRITDRQEIPAAVRQLWVLAGRRSGKSMVAAFFGVYYAALRDWGNVLARGELGVVQIICPDRKQGRVILNYAKAFVEEIPELAQSVEQIAKESIEFTNGIRLEIRTASYRTVRGYSVVCCIVDEAAFLKDDSSANPFGEILTALKPAMATTDGLLIVITTPYSRTGEVWKYHQQYYGQEHPSILFVKGPTQLFNPTMPERVITDAFETDPAAAASEYGSLEDGIQFRSDVEGFATFEAVQAAIIDGCIELPHCSEFGYVAFTDPSGGSSDSFTLAIAHREGDVAVLDCLRECRPPFSPAQVVEEFSKAIESYGIHTVKGDRYAGEFSRELFRKSGIEYEPSAKSKSDIYLELLPMLNSGRAQLLDNKRLVSQLCGLERRTSRSGKDSIDHAPGRHDDLINAAAGALVETRAARAPGDYGITI